MLTSLACTIHRNVNRVRERGDRPVRQPFNVGPTANQELHTRQILILNCSVERIPKLAIGINVSSAIKETRDPNEVPLESCPDEIIFHGQAGLTQMCAARGSKRQGGTIRSAALHSSAPASVGHWALADVAIPKLRFVETKWR